MNARHRRSAPFDGFYGSLMKQVPPIVATTLLFYLLETKLSLPSHLKYIKVHRRNLNAFERFQKKIADSLELFVEKFYEPTLRMPREQSESLATLAPFTSRFS